MLLRKIHLFLKHCTSKFSSSFSLCLDVMSVWQLLRDNERKEPNGKREILSMTEVRDGKNLGPDDDRSR